MSIVQRLFNDFSQISVVGGPEIIALGLAGRLREREQKNNNRKVNS